MSTLTSKKIKDPFIEQFTVHPESFVKLHKKGSFKDWRKYVIPAKGKKKEDIVSQIDKIAYDL